MFGDKKFRDSFTMALPMGFLKRSKSFLYFFAKILKSCSLRNILFLLCLEALQLQLFGRLKKEDRKQFKCGQRSRMPAQEILKDN